MPFQVYYINSLTNCFALARLTFQLKLLTDKIKYTTINEETECIEWLFYLEKKFAFATNRTMDRQADRQTDRRTRTQRTAANKWNEQ